MMQNPVISTGADYVAYLVHYLKKEINRSINYMEMFLLVYEFVVLPFTLS